MGRAVPPRIEAEGTGGCFETFWTGMAGSWVMAGGNIAQLVLERREGREGHVRN